MDDSKLERKAFWLGFGVAFLFLFSANDIILLFSMPKFQQIFTDALPGKPLPPVTEFYFAYRIALLILALARPILACVFIRLRVRHTLIWIALGTLWTILELGFGLIGMFMPMVSEPVGMSDSPHP